MASNATKRPAGAIAKAAAWEAGVWRSLYSWVRKRPIGVAPGDAAFGYAKTAAPILWVFVALSAFEIPLLHFVIPWRTVQVIFLLLGAWGLLWMVGLLASFYVHPHLITASGIRVRSSLGVDLLLDWDDITAVGIRRRTLTSSKTVQLERAQNGATAHVTVSSMTNIEIDLEHAMVLDLPKAGDQPVTVLCIYADDPKAFLAEVRRRQHDPDTAN